MRAQTPPPPPPSGPRTDPAELLGRIERVALANLAKKAGSGATLSDADWQRFEQLQRKIEGGDPSSPITPILAELRDLRAKGKPTPKRLERVAREAWLADMAAHIWPDLAAATPDIADELGGVSAGTVKNRLREWGIDAARTAISKAQVWLALARHYRAEAAAAATTAARPAVDHVGDDLKRMRLIEKTERLKEAAHDAAMQGLQRLLSRIRPDLVRETAARAADRLEVPDRLAAERIIGEEIAAALSAARNAARADHPETDH